MPIIHSVGHEHLEVGLYPTSDLFAIAQIALATGVPIPMGEICKVSVNFVLKPLTSESRNDKPKYPGAEPDEQLDTFRCSDVDHT